MDTSALFLYEKLIQMHNDALLGSIQSKSLTGSDAGSLTCEHHNTCKDDGSKTVCLDCGEVTEENHVITLHYMNGFNMTNRRVLEPSIYSLIPTFIDQEIKALAVEIYNAVTNKKAFRNTAKKALVMASLHRAAALCKEGSAISYYDLLEMFNLQQHEANKGFNILSSGVSKTSPYFKIFDYEQEEILGISSKIKQLKISDPSSIFFRLTVNTFLLLKKKSTAVNSAQYCSVICGCIYFWAVHLNYTISEEMFVKDARLSKTTLLRNYTIVCEVVFKHILKSLFSILLQKCIQFPIAKPLRRRKVFPKAAVSPEEMLYNPDDKCTLYNPFDPEKITVICKGRSLPLDTVDDILDWNLLLGTYYITTDVTLNLRVVLNKRNDKYVYFDFLTYNKLNQVDGQTILRDLLLKTFDSNTPFGSVAENDADFLPPSAAPPNVSCLIVPPKGVLSVKDHLCDEPAIEDGSISFPPPQQKISSENDI